MIVASIDIGSNTVLMLISEINFLTRQMKDIANFYKTPRISRDVLKTGRISDEKTAELFEVLSEYDRIIKENKCDKIFVNATNAFRIASNGEEIKNRIKEKFGWEINIIDGSEEARLSFLGAAFPFNGDMNTVVIDIGGGSTEIILGNSREIIYRKSFSIGVVSLKDLFMHNDPPFPGQIKETELFSDNTFAELRNMTDDDFKVIAVAGTPTTLASIKFSTKEYSEEMINNSVLSASEITGITKRLEMMKSEDIKKEFGSVVAGREDVLFAGCIILKSAMKNIGVEEITVSTKGLRYGPVVDFLLNQAAN